MTQREALWTRLAGEGIVEGPPPDEQRLESPWYMRLLTAFSGWLAALFLLGFVAAGFVYVFEHSSIALLTGVVMIAVAYVLLQRDTNEFVEHLALALSLAGQALVVWAIFRFNAPGWSGSSWLWVALLEIALTWLMPSFVHRVFSAFVAATALSLAFAQMHVPYVMDSVLLLGMAWIWLNLFRYPQHIGCLRAIGYGLVLAQIPLKSSVLFQSGGLGWRLQPVRVESWLQPWMAELLTVAVVVYVVWQLLQRYRHGSGERITRWVLATALLIALLSLEAPGLASALVILLLGFAMSNRVLLGLGIAALLFFVSSYYYLLDITLLAKAGHLLLIGLVLLVLRVLGRRYLFATEDADVGER